MQIDRNIAEGGAPFRHRRIIMRMRNRDRLQTAETVDDLDHRVVDQADAVPQHIALRRPHQQRALADAEQRRRADSDQFRLMTKRRHMGGPQLRQTRPALAGRRHELTLFIANQTPGRRLFRRLVLRSTGRANESVLHRLASYWWGSKQEARKMS